MKFQNFKSLSYPSLIYIYACISMFIYIYSYIKSRRTYIATTHRLTSQYHLRNDK